MAAPYQVLVIGNPVLNTRSDDVTNIDGKLVQLCQDMFTTMYEAPGIGLAAPQIGVQKRFFVYDLGAGDGQQVLINPEITGTDGESEYFEGCLSIPGLHFDIIRPERVGVRGVDLEGNEVEFEADDLLARLVQHELDHLDGILMLERMDDDQRKVARRKIRELQRRSEPPADQEPKRSVFRFR
ncbi:MAG: peptide deformylase [Actinomycetes bacterium]